MLVAWNTSGARKEQSMFIPWMFLKKSVIRYYAISGHFCLLCHIYWWAIAWTLSFLLGLYQVHGNILFSICPIVILSVFSFLIETVIIFCSYRLCLPNLLQQRQRYKRTTRVTRTENITWGKSLYMYTLTCYRYSVVNAYHGYTRGK